MSRSKRMVADISHYSLFSLITQVINVVSALVMRFFLGPLQAGIWSFLQVFLSYAEYANLGVLNAVIREIPFYNGKGDTARSETIKNAVFSFSMVTSLAAALAVLAYAVLDRHRLRPELFMALLFASGLILLQRLNGLLITLLRAYKHFTVAADQMLATTAVNAVLIALLSYRFRLFGFMLAMLLSLVFNIVYILWRQPTRFSFSLRRSELEPLIRYSFPIMVITALGAVFETIDRLLITGYLGFESLGLYGIALMTSTYIYSLPNSISVVVVSNLHEKFGENEDPRAFASFLLNADLVFSRLMPVVIGAAFFIVPPVIERILPKFAGGIPALRLLVAGTYFMTLGQNYSQFLYAVKKHMAFLAIYPVSTLSAAALVMGAIRLGWGIEGVAAAVVAAGAIQFTLVYAYSARMAYPAAKAAGHYAGLLIKFALMAALLFGLGRWQPAGAAMPDTLLRLLVLCAVYAPGLIQVARHLDAFAVIKTRFFGQKEAAS